MEQTRMLPQEDGRDARGQKLDANAKKSSMPTRMQKYRSPHEARSISGSNSHLIKGLAARIQLHCAPTHNWESRRKDLRASVREQMAAMGSTALSHHATGGSLDKVDRNIANAWYERMPCMVDHNLSKQHVEGQMKLCQVAQKREELRQQWVKSHLGNRRRLEKMKEEKEAERNRAIVKTRQHFWLTMLWSSAAQELLGKAIIQARGKRKELENAHHQIVYIQSMVRMLLARKAFYRLKEATMMIQKGVRKFLRMLYLRRRRDGAALIIRFLRTMHHDSALKKAFQKLIKSIQTLKAFMRRYCMVRDSRIIMLKTQWVKWETLHARQPMKDMRKLKLGISFGVPTPAGQSVENSFSVVPVADSIKQIICRQHCTAKATEIVRKLKQREKRRKQLLQIHEVDVLLEKCWLMEVNPEDNPEYINALKQIEVDLGPPPVLKTMETLATLSKLHRQGMRMQDKQRLQEKQRQEGQQMAESSC